MKKYIYSSFLAIAAATALTGCDDVFSPAPENNLPLDFLEQNAHYAENMLGVVYTYIPNNGGYPFSEVATDDAVSNDAGNGYRRMAEGLWTASNNPTNRWENCRSAIQYCNIFLANVDKVQWTKDEVANALFRERFIAEARALRAIHLFYLLQAHAGVDAQGNLLGLPIVTEPEGAGSNFNLPRNTYVQCLQAIEEDIAAAMEVLPAKWGASSYDDIRAKHPGITEGQLERVYGSRFTGRVCGIILDGYLGRLALMSASPAFEASGRTWEQAADQNAKIIDFVGGIYALDQKGANWYCDPNIKQLGEAEMPAEVLWRSGKGDSNSLEKDNFPPTLYGNGRINPTQNLVDAFPMANGYPINHELSDYSAQNPYADRDPRLAMYILYNGATAGHNNSVIKTNADGTTNDALNKITTSTRTGYYLKKLLRQDVNCDPNNNTQQSHYTARMRMTEFFLNYAEAANEAWGPTGTGSHDYSAYDIIREIRIRAGLGFENGDAYLKSAKNDKDLMREIIRNERRLELCFEGFRFYDLRRWKAELNEPANGMNITAGVFTPFQVETRNYGAHMFYGPIPYSEILKFSELQQNAGW